MARLEQSQDIKFLDRNSLVDLILLFALVNVAVGFGQMMWGDLADVSWILRLAAAVALTIGLHRISAVRKHQYAPDADNEPVVQHLSTAPLQRQHFFTFLDKALRKEANGFLMLFHANNISELDKRYGSKVGDFFLNTLVARLDPSVTAADLIGCLERDTFAAFLRDRTQDEAALIGRRMSSTTLLPLGDSADRAQLSAFVGFTEVKPKEPILDALERANIALSEAQMANDANSVMWTAKLRNPST